MTQLLKKGVKFEWTEACEKSLRKLKELLTMAPVLALPEKGKDFEVYTNASKNRLGCVLMQGGKVIAYAL